MEIFFPDSIGFQHNIELKGFLQLIANRAAQGHCRYGNPKKSKKYLARLKMEIAHYEEFGNLENLINVAVYCFLESEAPQNRKFHFDNTIDSVTRGKI